MMATENLFNSSLSNNETELAAFQTFSISIYLIPNKWRMFPWDSDDAPLANNDIKGDNLRTIK